MAESYSRLGDVSGVRFSKTSFGSVARSRMVSHHQHITTFDAGELIPLACLEVLPESEFSVSMESIIRQMTMLTPTMGKLSATVTAFFVPNRVVNDSFKAVQGENYSGSWIAPEVSLAPLYDGALSSVQVPVGSIADYYGFPTQKPISKEILQQCHDLKFRGYASIWNEFFRDQNYQPPIPLSKLNVYQGFFENGNIFKLGGTSDAKLTEDATLPDGSYPNGAIGHALYGSTTPTLSATIPAPHSGQLNALGHPLKVNKLHDYFTSVLPSPLKGPKVMVPATNEALFPVITQNTPHAVPNVGLTGQVPAAPNSMYYALGTQLSSGGSGPVDAHQIDLPGSAKYSWIPNNLYASASNAEISISIDDLRMSAAMQQYYEVLARGGSRYREIVRTLFGVEADNPFSDVPVCLAKKTFDLDMYQTAQTSASETGNTPQGNLAAFGYTSKDNYLFSSAFVEHGYIHIFVTVRHKNLYSSMLARDNFRQTALDFYSPPFANISNQPVYSREINPFSPKAVAGQVFGYNEAWSEYRYDPDRVSGLMRPGITDEDGNNISLAVWNYADAFDPNLEIADRYFLMSNTAEVVNRTLALTSSYAPQFKGQFEFVIDKTLPMPTESIPGMDII